jgi:hypothetical protein
LPDLQKCGLFSPLEYLGRFFNRFEKIHQHLSSTLEPVDSDWIICQDQGPLRVLKSLANQVQKHRVLQLAAVQRLHVLAVWLWA